MTVALLAGLVLAGFAAGRLGWRAVARTLYLIAALSFLLIGCGPVPRLLLRSLQAGYGTQFHDWGARNVIVLLGDGTSVSDRQTVEVPLYGYGRVVRAAELYRDCRQRSADCRILISGGDPMHNGQSEAAAYALQLRALGVAPADLILEPRSRNTWENAQYTAALLRHAPPYDRLVLVTSGYHLRRGTEYFGRFGLAPQPVRAEYLSVLAAVMPTAENFQCMDLALHEYAGLWRHRL